MNPQETAVVFVGYQNDYFAKDGILRGVVEEPHRVDEVLSNTLAFIEAVGPTTITLIATPIVLAPDYRAMAEPVGILYSMKVPFATLAASASCFERANSAVRARTRTSSSCFCW